MKKLNLLALMVVALCTGLNAAADNLPSPCEPGQPGAGVNCMYLVAAGNVYDPATGERSLSDAPLALTLQVWIDFSTANIIGGGFDIIYDISQVSEADWAWSDEFLGFATLSGGPGESGWEGIQFDDFGGNGFNEIAFVGTLSLSLTQPAVYDIGIAQPYALNTFPNCFVLVSDPVCEPANFFGIQVTAAGQADSDDDGVFDSTDNCIDAFNPDQRDVDADGFGSLCDADFNNDCQVNFADLNAFSQVFFTGDPETDLNGDGMVNFADLNILSQLFFQPPGPSALATCLSD